MVGEDLASLRAVERPAVALVEPVRAGVVGEDPERRLGEAVGAEPLDAGGEEHESSIVFDGERGTMKVGGGPRSAFAARIADHIKFWVRERGCVPGLLAALTIEFFEERMAAEGKMT